MTYVVTIEASIETNCPAKRGEASSQCGKRIISVPFSGYTRGDAELSLESWLRRWGGRVISKQINVENA